jgi:hypothetical protein
MLRFEPKAAQEEAEALRTTGYLRRPFATEPLSLENAWYPGLRWNMIPLYDGRYPDEVPLAMRDDLFRTSYFSPTAGARTDAGLWQHFESRYGLGFQRTSQRAFRALARRARIAELRRDGRTIPEIAGALLDEGLHPLDEKEAHAARQTTGVPRQKLEISAAETVHAILKSLRKDKKAKVPALRPGRPRKNTKDGPQADERPTASGLDV